MRRFNVGDLVYYAKCRYEQKSIPCPVCFSKREVTLILGNGEPVVLPCNYCAPGYQPPSGFVSEYDYVVEAEPVRIDKIDVEVTREGEHCKYRSACYVYDDQDLFESETEALLRAQEKKAELDKEQVSRVDYLKKSKKASFSWNAGYHLREARRAREEAERHEEKARLCKERAKA